MNNETGEGTVSSCELFPGVQVIVNDLHLRRCASPVTPNERVVQISCCVEGRYECVLNERYCFFVGPGDFSVGTVGRRESRGGFPTGRFYGVSFFLELDALEQQNDALFQEFQIDVDKIAAIAQKKRRYYVLHRIPELGGILSVFLDVFEKRKTHVLKLKTLEILSFLSELDEAAVEESPVYVNRKQVALAKAVQERLVEDIARHVTIEQMSQELHAGTTMLKTAFKSVYGVPIYQYQRDLRLQLAQKLIRDTDQSFTQISSVIGYVSSAKFSQAFKAKFGLTPSEYRRQTRGI